MESKEDPYARPEVIVTFPNGQKKNRVLLGLSIPLGCRDHNRIACMGDYQTRYYP